MSLPFKKIMITIEDIVNLNDELSNRAIKNKYFVDQRLEWRIKLGLTAFILPIGFVLLCRSLFNFNLWLSLVIGVLGICALGGVVVAIRKDKRTDAILVKRYYSKYRSSDKITSSECYAVFKKVRYEKWLEFCEENNIAQDYKSLSAIKDRLKLRLERPVDKWLLLKNNQIVSMMLQAPITVISIICGFYVVTTTHQIKEIAGVIIFLMIVYWLILWMIGGTINSFAELYKTHGNRYWPLFEVLDFAISKSPIDQISRHTPENSV